MTENMQTLKEKTDIILSTITERTEPMSSLSLLDICLHFYNKIALTSQNKDEILYAQPRIRDIAKLRQKIRIHYSTMDLEIETKHPAAG